MLGVGLLLFNALVAAALRSRGLFAELTILALTDAVFLFLPLPLEQPHMFIPPSLNYIGDEIIKNE